MLWEQVMNEWEARPWLEKLQNNLLFWLQLFALILLMVALVRPYWYEEGLKGDELIFVIDTSASMSAQVNGETIFSQKKKEMKEMINQLANEEVTIIEARKRPTILVKNMTDPSKLREIIDQLTISYEHENIEKALSFAQMIAKGKNSVIHLFTDGVDETLVSNIVTKQMIVVHNTEQEIENVSVKSFGVGPVQGKIGGIAVIENQTEKEKEVSFSVISEGKTFKEEKLVLKPKEEKILSFSPLQEAKYYQAIIDVDDDYKIDNEWVAVYTNMRPPVYAIGVVNPFFIKGFESIGVQTIQLEEKEIGNIEIEGIILTEEDKFIDRANQPVIFSEAKENSQQYLEQPITKLEDPLLQYVDFEKVYIQKSNPKPIEGLTTIVKSGENPLIQKGLKNDMPIVALRFSLEQSDWPLHPSFPIFLFNSYQWIVQHGNGLGYFQPGEEKWLNIAKGEKTIEIFNDKGKNLATIQTDQTPFRAPNQPGLYHAISGNELLYFAVHLDEREREIKTGDSFQLNEEILQPNAEKENKKWSELWFWLVVVAFVLLVSEWEVYRRRAGI